METDPFRDYPFCSNPDCLLHVYAGSANVVGWGNWAELPDGRIIGRGVYCGIFLCDSCRREWRAVSHVAPTGVEGYSA